jgi:hypothetical protein
MIAMPTPSRFREGERRVILAAVGIGASRNTAARLAKIRPATLHRWLVRGAKASEGSRFAQFRAALLEAERTPRTQLLPVPNLDDVADAWRIADREWRLPPAEDWRPPEWDDENFGSVPRSVRLTFHGGTPIGGPDRAG